MRASGTRLGQDWRRFRPPLWRGRVERRLSHVGAAPGRMGRKARHAGGAQRRVIGTRRHRLHQFAWHRNAEQRSLGESGGHEHFRSDDALQLDQGGDRPHIGCRRRIGGGDLRTRHPQWNDAGRRPDDPSRPDSDGALHKRESAFAAEACAQQFFRLRRHELQFDFWPRGMKLPGYVAGIGVLGPGLHNWPQAAAVLSGRQPYAAEPTVLPIPSMLPPAERRRTGRVVKLALGVALEATARADADPAQMPSVFSSSGGDGHICHEICQALALSTREVSPTRFSNSVHNVAAGYWSIATGSMTESNVLCAFDASFVAGPLDVLSPNSLRSHFLLLLSYPTAYSPPLHPTPPLSPSLGVSS